MFTSLLLVFVYTLMSMWIGTKTLEIAYNVIRTHQLKKDIVLLQNVPMISSMKSLTDFSKFQYPNHIDVE